jgi:hypothetical protein
MNDGGGNWNRAARRSGGDRSLKLGPARAGEKRELPSLSIQCFEQRHGDCCGRVGFFPGPCECPCHKRGPAHAD